MVQPQQGPPNHLRGEAGGHCWTGERARESCGPACSWLSPPIPRAGREGDSSSQVQPGELHPVPVAPARGPLNPRGQFTGEGGMWITCLEDPAEEELSEDVHQSCGSRKRLFALGGICPRSK